MEKMQSDAFAETSKFFGQVRFNRFVLLLRLFALAPGLERDKEKSAVSTLHQTKQAKANNACRVLHPRRFTEKIFNLSTGLIGALERSGVRQLERNDT